MGVRLTNMLGVVRETTLKYDGEAVPFAYRPNVVTLALLDDIETKAEDDDLDGIARMLEPVLVWWDVLDENDQRIQPTYDAMRGFPIRFLTSIVDRIQEDSNPERKG